MSLDFTKVTYVDGETVIGADNLNDIQDALLDLDSNKVETEQGKGLSSNDYTTVEKNKLANIEAGATNTVVDSAMSDSSTNPVQNAVISATLKAGTEATAEWHLGFYLDENGDLCQVEDEEETSDDSEETALEEQSE